MENDEVPPRDSFDNDEDYEEARRLSAARIRADEERTRIQTRNTDSSLFKDDEKYFHRLDNLINQTKELDAQRILALHHTRMVGEKERAAAAGVYRLTDVYAGEDPIGLPAWEIPAAMTDFSRWLKAAEEALNGGGGELARFVATAHLRLVFSTQLLAQVNSSGSESMNC
ncbi:hypothetical protein niasHT_018393 [Heterodera trifolii]|uniref:Uncharacterized protein n=1 Tax=Heterodera trifolii TaxID=157864 RepID=A0ABD2LDM8_9BILA